MIKKYINATKKCKKTHKYGRKNVYLHINTAEKV